MSASESKARPTRDPGERRGATKTPNAPTEAAIPGPTGIEARAREVQARASALLQRVDAGSEAAARVQKLLLQLSMVRASTNPDRALDQLAGLERELAGLEVR